MDPKNIEVKKRRIKKRGNSILKKIKPIKSKKKVIFAGLFLIIMCCAFLVITFIPSHAARQSKLVEENTTEQAVIETINDVEIESTTEIEKATTTIPASSETQTTVENKEGTTVTTIPEEKKAVTEVMQEKNREPVLVNENSNKQYNNLTEGQIIAGKATHYCACTTCNGSNSGSTASGINVFNGMENPYIVACNWLPIGTIINVDGIQYTVMDRGGNGLSSVGRVDVFTPEGHNRCYELGVKTINIEIVSLSKTNSR